MEVWKKKLSFSSKKPKPNFSLTKITKLSQCNTDEMITKSVTILSKPVVSLNETPVKNAKKVRNQKLAPKLIENNSWPILENGSILNDFYQKTCAFDSFIQCALNSFNIFKMTNSQFKSLLIALSDHDIVLAYKLRNELLTRLFGIQNSCECNVTKISDCFLKLHPGVVLTFKCQNCLEELKEQKPYAKSDVTVLENYGFRNIERCLEEFRKRKCRVCNEQMDIKIVEPIETIVISTEFRSSQPATTLTGIQPIINYHNLKYEIMSLVSHINSAAPHYVSYCKRELTWEKYDDLQSSIKYIRNPDTEKVTPHLIFYKQIRTEVNNL